MNSLKLTLKQMKASRRFSMALRALLAPMLELSRAERADVLRLRSEEMAKRQELQGYLDELQNELSNVNDPILIRI